MARIDFERDRETYAEGRRLREEERAYYETRIVELAHERKVASLRAHAIGNEQSRLTGIANKLMRFIEANNLTPPAVVIENEELLRYLAELEGLPAPPRAVRKEEKGDG